MILLSCVLLTIIVEVLFFLAVGPRTRDFLILCVLTNAVTNISLNLILYTLVHLFGFGQKSYWITAAILELGVVLIEYLLYHHFLFQDKSLHRPLLIKTLTANILSCGIGCIVSRLSIFPWPL